jgi:hypothetical protein
VERRRWKERGKKVVPRQWRLCRFCYIYVEDAPHALFVCEHPELKVIRDTFLEKLNVEIPGVVKQFPDPLQLFRGLGRPAGAAGPTIVRVKYFGFIKHILW